jgi:hypothetical protein
MAAEKLIASEPTPGQMIHELHCWIATYSDGTEGIIAGGFEGIGMTPLLSSRRTQAEAMEPMARQAQLLTKNEPIRVLAIRLVTYRRTDD